MKLTKFAAVLACAVFGMSASVQAATYKIATNVSDKDTAAQMIAKFAKGVEDRTEGRVKFKIFGNGVLGSQGDYLQQVQKGVVDAALINSATLESIVPAFGVINLPYMFRSLDEYSKVMSDPSVKDVLMEGAGKHRIVPLGFLSNGFRSLMTTKPVRSIEDLKGMKIRTMSSETYVQMLDAFGAVPTPMAYTDTFPALQQGIIDGAEGGFASLTTMNYGQATKYAVRTEQTRLSDFVVSSQRFQKKVGPDDFKIVLEEFDKVSAESLKVVDAFSDGCAEEAHKTMGVEIIEVDKAPFIAAVQPMYKAAMNNEEKSPVIKAIFKIEDRSME